MFQLKSTVFAASCMQTLTWSSAIWEHRGDTRSTQKLMDLWLNLCQRLFMIWLKHEVPESGRQTFMEMMWLFFDSAAPHYVSQLWMQATWGLNDENMRKLSIPPRIEQENESDGNPLIPSERLHTWAPWTDITSRNECENHYAQNSSDHKNDNLY